MYQQNGNIHSGIFRATLLLVCLWALQESASSLTTSAESPTGATRLEKVVVTAARLPGQQTEAAKAPAHVTVISREQIVAAPAFTLPELLRQQAGLLPLDTVGFGQFAGLSMRGFGEKTGTLILVDGVRVNDAGSSDLPFLWNSIPLKNIERIEIIRGGGSTIYGEGAAAGVINIITRGAADAPVSVGARAAAGNLGFYGAHADVSGTQDRFQYFISGDRQEWDGWRDFSAYRAWSAQVKPSIDTDIGWFAFGYYFHTERSENPGNLSPAQFAADSRQRGAFPVVFENDIHRFTLDYSHITEGGWTLLAKVFGQVFDSTSTSDFGISEIEQPNHGLTLQAGTDAKLFGRGNIFTIGAEAIQQDFFSTFTSAWGLSASGADHWTVSVFAQNTHDLTEQLALTVGARYDHREWDVLVLSPFDPDIRSGKKADVFSPKVGLLWRAAEDVQSWLTLSRSYRLPSGFDIGAAGAIPGQLFFANPSIDPVDVRTLEVGARCNRSQWLGGSIVYFYSDVRDDILYNPFTWMNENFDSIRQGVELSLNSRPREATDFYFTAAWVDAQFDGGGIDGKRLPLVPEWQLTGGVNLLPCKGLQLTLEAVHVRGQVATNDLTNSFGRNDYTVVNARAQYQWSEVMVFAAVNNLFDKLYEAFPAVTSFPPQTRGHNPAPGINFQVGGSVRF